MSLKNLGAAALCGVFALGLAGAGAAGDQELGVARAGAGMHVANLPSGVILETMRLAPDHGTEHGRAVAPMGWVDFCARYACDREKLEAGDIVFEGDVRQLIEAVNANVNAAIAPRTDMAHWGVEERWDFAETGVGDCEDVALLKQRWLVSAGLPRSSLLVTVVTDLSGAGHAVLTAVTDRGDYVLDNMHDDVKLWRETPYGFVKRQSRAWADEWVSLRDRGAQPAVAAR